MNKFEYDKTKKYVKVVFNTFSGADENLEYKFDEVNVAKVWNVKAKTPRKMGGFNFSTEDNILRWLHRGDTICDVIIPEDAEVIDVNHGATPKGVFRTNKIILTNPKPVTDDVYYGI